MSNKSNDAWEAFNAGLTPQTRAALGRAGAVMLPVPTQPEAGEDDDVVSYREFVSKLTPQTQAAMNAPKPKAAAQPEVEVGLAKWGLVEAPDGEWAQMRLFKTEEGLVTRLQQLEGSDTVVWCFFGVPLPLTKGPQRVLLLPGGKEGITVPMFEGGPSVKMAVGDPDELVFEKMGYLGPPELAEAPPSQEKLEAKAALSGDDDDDD